VAVAAVGVAEDAVGRVERRVVLRVAVEEDDGLQPGDALEALVEQSDAGVELVVAGPVAGRPGDHHQLLRLRVGGESRGGPGDHRGGTRAQKLAAGKGHGRS
jgi:hypothetical protein